MSNFTVRLGDEGGLYTLSPGQRRRYFPRRRVPPHDIGCGGHACVYPLGAKKVVKFTWDWSDAYASELVRRKYRSKGHPNLVRIYEVRQLGGDPEFGPWAIVAERLSTPPEVVAKRVYCAARTAGAVAFSPVDATIKCQAAAAVGSPRVGGSLRWYCHYYGQTVAGRQALARLGIGWDDRKMANWGYRPGSPRKWAILDFGSSFVGVRPRGGLKALLGALPRGRWPGW